MIGIDTNLVVRLLTNDDKTQTAYVVQLFETNAIFIPKTVLLETEWVLRFSYNLTPSMIQKAFEKLLGLPQVTVEDSVCILKALEWYQHNLDFADALHLASSDNIEKFVTLDKKFIKKARKINIHLMTMDTLSK